MIDWVNEALKNWGEAKRRIIGRQDKQLRNKDGTPSKTMACGPARSFMGRLDEGGHVGKGKDQIVLSAPPEIYMGDALIAALGIQRALDCGHLSERGYKLLFVHYVVSAKLDKKIRYMGISRKHYFDGLGQVHVKILSHLNEAAKLQAESTH